MFCLASRYETAPANLDGIVRMFREQALPLVSRQPGFKGLYLLTKPNGEFIVLNIWDTEQQAEAWPANPEHQQIVAQLKLLLTGPPAREGYEVRAHAVAQS